MQNIAVRSEIFKLVVFALIFSELLAVALFFRMPFTLLSPSFSRVTREAVPGGLKLFDMDWLPPIIKVNMPNRELKFAATEFSIISNEVITPVSLPDGWELLQVTGRRYLLRTARLPDGKHKYDITVADRAGNIVSFRLEITAGKGRPVPPQWPEAKFTADGDALTAIVNKQSRLPQDYEPKDLVALGEQGIPNNNSASIRNVALKDLIALVSHAQSAGIDITVTSGYRSFGDQYGTYSYWVGYSGGSMETADTFSARPGHSEHQLGTAVDFLTRENGSSFDGFEHTELARWLAENAYKYGFMISYPQGKEAVTGYQFEPWHYRYIGKKNAEAVRVSGLTLTEWLYNQ